MILKRMVGGWIFGDRPISDSQNADFSQKPAESLWKIKFPEGPKIKKIGDFERDSKFRASHPPRPYFLWGNRDVEIEIFDRDWNFDRDWKFRSGLNFFGRWALSLSAGNSLINLVRRRLANWPLTSLISEALLSGNASFSKRSAQN